MIFGPGDEEYDRLLDFTKGELIEEVCRLRAEVDNRGPLLTPNLERLLQRVLNERRADEDGTA